MSFRKEIKLKINPDNKSLFIKELIYNDFNEIYPKRTIESIYFDNNRNFSFLDSEEGIVPRKKIRLRRYKDKNEYSHYKLETKVSSFEGRFKSVKEINKNELSKMLKLGVLDNMYGLCLPKLIIAYERLYFGKNNFRVTVDMNVNCKKTKDKFYKKININAFETKTKFNITDDEINKKFKQNKIRLSKYAEAFKLLY
jgi:hypothetical protein